MGYLVNVAITYITDAILAQQDITEDESIQLTELLRTLHPLEELFILEPGQVRPPSFSRLEVQVLIFYSRQASSNTYMDGSNSATSKNSLYVHSFPLCLPSLIPKLVGQPGRYHLPV